MSIPPHLPYLECPNPECRRPMVLRDWTPGHPAIWECHDCAVRYLLGRRILEGSYNGRLALAPMFAREEPKP